MYININEITNKIKETLIPPTNQSVNSLLLDEGPNHILLTIIKDKTVILIEGKIKIILDGNRNKINCAASFCGCCNIRDSLSSTNIKNSKTFGDHIEKFKNLVPLDFLKDEFGLPFTLRSLCDVIVEDISNLQLKSDINTIDWLNDLLRVTDLYDILCQKNPKPIFSQRIAELEKKTKNYRRNSFIKLNSNEQTNIKLLNRLILEDVYPLTPKCRKWGGLEYFNFYKKLAISINFPCPITPTREVFSYEKDYSLNCGIDPANSINLYRYAIFEACRSSVSESAVYFGKC